MAPVIAFMCFAVLSMLNESIHRQPARPDEIVFGVVITALVLGVSTRLMRMAVVLTPDRLVIRNLATSRRILWRDIALFLPPTTGVFARSIGVELASGKRIGMSGIAPNRWADPEDSRDLIGLLDRARTESIHRCGTGVTPRPLVLRRRLAAVVAAICFGVIALIGVLGAADAFRSDDASGHVVMGLVMVATAAVSAYMVAAVIWASVVVRPDGLVIRNYVRRHFVAWSAIESIDPPGAGQYCPSVTTRDGRVIVCKGLSLGLLQSPRASDRVVRAMRDALEQAVGKPAMAGERG